jgi:long-subunit fatty acid transport protein
MKPLIILALGVVCTSFEANAQTAEDALRYSQLTFGGTARYDAMGGAFGALGADFSTLSSNPAGIGLYRKSELSFTPSIYNAGTSSTYNGMTESGNKSNLIVGNGGIILTHNKHKSPDEGGWQTVSFGFGYNRLADYDNSSSVQGYNYNSSLTNVFVHNANNSTSNGLDPFNEGLAYNTYLIDNPGGSGTSYVSYMPTGGVLQQNSVQSSGSMGETVLTLGGNYDNKLYLGMTVGFDNINYSSQTSYSETALRDSAGGVHSFTQNSNVNTTGQGVNYKLGLIYRINDWVRFGVAYHSPTYFTMHDDYYSSMTTNFKDSSFHANSPGGSYNYTLTTPGRAIGSLAFIISKKALIGIDYEYIDYTTASLNSSDPTAFTSANSAIQNNYRATGNIRVGAEYRLVEGISVRAGYAYYGSPYQSSANIDASRQSYSCGLGFRERNHFLDLAYVYTMYNVNSYLYDPTIAAVNPISNAVNNYSLMMTFGVKF